MCKSLFKFFFGFIAVILFFLGGTSFILRDRILRDEIYLNSISEQKVYNIVIEQYINSLKTASGSNISSQDLLMSTVKEISKDNKIPAILQQSIENTVKYIFQYMRGETDKVYLYIPGNEIRDLVTPAKLRTALINAFDNANKDYDSLSVCNESDLMVLSAEDLLSNPKLPCKLPTARTKADLLGLVGAQIDDTLRSADIENSLDNSLGGFNGKVSLEDSLKNTTDTVDIKTTLDDFATIRSALYFWGVASIGVMFVGVICMLIQILFSNLSLKNIIINISIDGIFTGLLMGLTGLAGLVFGFIIPQYFRYSLPKDILGISASPAGQDAIAPTILEVAKSIVIQLALPLLIVGALLFVGFLAVRMFMMLFRSKKTQESHADNGNTTSEDSGSTKSELSEETKEAPATNETAGSDVPKELSDTEASTSTEPAKENVE